MNKSLKILIVTNQFPAISTPFILNIITGLIDEGCEVSVVSCEKGDYLKVHDRYSAYKSRIKIFTIDKAANFYLNRVLFAVKNTNFLKFKEIQRLFKAYNFLKHGRHALSGRYFYECLTFSNISNYDLTHAQFGPNGVMLARLKQDGFLKGPFITHFRGYDVSKIFKFHSLNFYNRLFQDGDYFIANCNYFLDKIISLGAPKEKSVVVYSGIDDNTFDNKKEYTDCKRNVLELCSVSRLSGKKGIEYNLKALSLIENVRPDIKFRYNIIGDGEKKNELVKLTNKLLLNDRVFFHGAKNHTYINSFLSSQDVFLSHNITSDEGDQDAPVNVIKEAFLVRLPVISTFHGGIPELVIDNFSGLLVKERDYKELAAKIIELNDNFSKRQILAENGERIVKERFLNKKIIEQLLSIYNSLLQSTLK